MTRWHYFDREHVDPDDDILHNAIEAELVPRSCRLGGPMLQRFLELGEDPCGFCPCDRDVCGGRPLKAEINVKLARDLLSAHEIDELAAEHRRMLRAVRTEQLNEILKSKIDG